MSSHANKQRHRPSEVKILHFGATPSRPSSTFANFMSLTVTTCFKFVDLAAMQTVMGSGSYAYAATLSPVAFDSGSGNRYRLLGGRNSRSREGRSRTSTAGAPQPPES